MITKINEFLIRNDINNKHIKTVESVHLYSVYFLVLNTVRPRRLVNLNRDISFLLGIDKCEVQIADKQANTICISIPKTERETLYFENYINDKGFKNFNGELKFILGQDTKGNIVYKDLVEMTHLLIAGQTGSGKSVFLNSLICSLLENKNTQFIMIDTKKVELSLYENLNSLLFPLCTTGEQAVSALSWAINEMNKRYDLLQKKSVRNIIEYNNIPKIKKMKRIVIIIDELADLMLQSSKDIENLICRIAQLSRACGIHLIIATQRPSHEVLTGLIKANLPTKIAFSVSSKINSRVILDKNGAEQLLGKGDMLFMSASNQDLERLQGTFIPTENVNKYVIKANKKIKKVAKQQDILLDTIVVYLKQKKIKFITGAEIEQVFKITEKESTDIMDKLEKLKYIGKYNVCFPREILI